MYCRADETHPVTCGTPAATRADRTGRCGALLLSMASKKRSCARTNVEFEPR